MPAPVTNGEAGSSVRGKINAGFVTSGFITPSTGNLDFTAGILSPSALVSAQAGNQISAPLKEWVGTQTAYNALAGSYDAGTRYSIIPG